MTILDTINRYKQKEVQAKQETFPISILEKSAFFERPCLSLANAIKNSRTGIIAEHKRKSPSKSMINDTAKLPEVVIGYQNAGASAISVLTDTPFFGGSLDDLLVARTCCTLPILRKEFIIEPYQIYEAKAYGADAILLIAASLSSKQLKTFSNLAKTLGLDVLVEVHDASELDRSLLTTVDLIGVNNRNLKTFEVTLETSKELAPKIPSEFVKISESGIHHRNDIRMLWEHHFQGFLIGEQFMKTKNPGITAQTFITSLS